METLNYFIIGFLLIAIYITYIFGKAAEELLKEKANQDP